MKITLLILGLIYLAMRLSTVKHLLDSKETQKFRWKGIMDEIRNSCKEKRIDFDTVIGCTWICTFAISLLITLFFLLSSIFIENFIFSIISILMIVKFMDGVIKCFSQYYRDGNVVYYGVLHSIVSFLISMTYIIFVFYNVYLGYGV